MIYKKHASPLRQYVSLLKEYYHVKSIATLVKALARDFSVSLFLFSGTGLLKGFIKGSIGRMFISSQFPLIIGSRFKVMHPQNIVLGHHVWMRDDVTLVANGIMQIGNETIIGERATLWSEGRLKIGNNVGIGKNAYIAQLGGSVVIGDNVLMADSVRIYSVSHKYENTKKIILQQGYKTHKITIADNVWIGSGVVIFNDVSIGEGAVIGANAVVNKSIPPYTVYVGNPGRIVKKLR